MAASAPIRLGTRRSALAQAQSGHVATALEAVIGRPVVLVPITSEGDTNRASLSEIGGQGIFATRLRDALKAGECDFLVHSLKDLPTEQPEGLIIAATPKRVDARDVAITRGGTPLHALHAGSRVGTGSPRRIAQVRRRNPRAEVVDIRGNVDSRLERVASGELDAVILAAAGLFRLDSDSPLRREELGLTEWPPRRGRGRSPSRPRRMLPPSCSPRSRSSTMRTPASPSRSSARSSPGWMPDARRRWPRTPPSRATASACAASSTSPTETAGSA